MTADGQADRAAAGRRGADHLELRGRGGRHREGRRRRRRRAVDGGGEDRVAGRGAGERQPVEGRRNPRWPARSACRPARRPRGRPPGRIVTEPTKFASRLPSEFSTSTVMPNGWPAATTDGGPEADRQPRRQVVIGQRRGDHPGHRAAQAGGLVIARPGLEDAVAPRGDVVEIRGRQGIEGRQDLRRPRPGSSRPPTRGPGRRSRSAAAQMGAARLVPPVFIHGPEPSESSYES